MKILNEMSTTDIIKDNKSRELILNYVVALTYKYTEYTLKQIENNKIEFEETRKGRKFSIDFKRDEIIDKISESYADVPEGDKLAFFNSAGYLEIAVNKGNAASLFGLQGFSEKQHSLQQQYMSSRLVYQSVKVFFE